MKKWFITFVMMGILAVSTSSVFANEVDLVEPLPNEEMVVMSIDEETLEANSTAGYPAGYETFTLESKTDGAGAYRMFLDLNKFRASVGESQLVLDGKLTEYAMHRAEQICTVYAHAVPSGNYEQPGYTSPSNSGENIVVGRDSAEEAFYAFENSSGHNAQMQADFYKRVGIGNYGGAWVMVFSEMDSVYKGWDLTQSEMNAYTQQNKVASVVVDMNTHKIMTLVNTGYIGTMDRGTTQQMTASLIPAGIDPIRYSTVYTKVVPSTVTWSSSNVAVASIDINGMVTANQTGTANITGTLNGKSFTKQITVTGNGTPPLTNFLVKYRTHVQNVGWQDYVADGAMSGTSGRSLRLEGINISLDPTVGGSIEYRTHVQNIGWQSFVANGTMSGTEGMSYRLEGIQIRLTGEAATKYDIYYHTHTQNIGWMGWAKNGEQSGSAGFSYRLEGIEIKLVPKGGQAPGSTLNAFIENVE